mmetsp:Transcript_125880/g.402968  ORF Transcript_125880/g.402968 Transcript_125880/m.402968 type:complete len:211 (+) Transcript_125880:2361-2993(+)
MSVCNNRSEGLLGCPQRRHQSPLLALCQCRLSKGFVIGGDWASSLAHGADDVCSIGATLFVSGFEPCSSRHQVCSQHLLGGRICSRDWRRNQGRRQRSPPAQTFGGFVEPPPAALTSHSNLAPGGSTPGPIAEVDNHHLRVVGDPLRHATLGQDQQTRTSALEFDSVSDKCGLWSSEDPSPLPCQLRLCNRASLGAHERRRWRRWRWRWW